DELGEVGRHRDQLGLDPQPPADRPREVRAAQLRQVLATGGADLGRQALDEHRNQVLCEDDPEQHVAVARAARDVRREVARVDVGDRGDERRAEQRDDAADAAARADALQLAGCGKGDAEVAHGVSTSTRMALASAPPRTWTSPPKRANSGPSNGCFSTTSKRSPGAMPRAAR